MKRWIALVIVMILALSGVWMAGKMYVRWQEGPVQEQPLEGVETPAPGSTVKPGATQAPKEDPMDLDSLLDGEKAVNVQDEFRYYVADGDYSVVEGLDKDVMNILLLGTDSEGALNNGRTDTMIICSIHVKTGSVKLSSIVRDLYVQMPGMQSKNKINAANSFGGPNMAIKCVNETFGLNVSRYVSINFNAFVDLVDLLGGVDLEITSGEAGQINKHAPHSPRVKAGMMHLDGDQSLQYCRIRKLDNNFGRNERQRKFLDAMVKKVISGSNMDTLMELVETGMHYVDTNLSTSDLFTILFTVLPNMGDMQMYSCPGQGEYHYDNSGTSAVIGHMDKVNASLHAFIYGETEE
ncbi:MAG: LCP family protein [Clostridia bacterium]|nr:LCP family protein [Clostridia bacterium]